MPRNKSLVHTHYRIPEEQPIGKKLQVAECIHCGKQLAGNNAARLLEHLQRSCWPCDNVSDPRLDMTRNPEAPPKNTPRRDMIQSLPRPNGQSTAAMPLSPSSHFLVQAVVTGTNNPVVSRMLVVPITFTFRHLERSLSTALGYKNTSGMFDVAFPASISGRSSGPPRTQHLYIFSDQEQRAKWHKWDEIPMATPDERMADEVPLRDLLVEHPDAKIIYLVRTWAHDVDVVGTIKLSGDVPGGSSRHAVCMSGEGHSVPESSDPMMWQAFKEAYRSPNPTAQQKGYRVYYEEECHNGDPRGLANGGPWRWEREHVNREMSMLPPAPQTVTSTPIGARHRAIGVEDTPQEPQEPAEDQSSDYDLSVNGKEGHSQADGGQSQAQNQPQSSNDTPSAPAQTPQGQFSGRTSHRPIQPATAHTPLNAPNPYENQGYMPATALQQLHYG